MVAPWPLINRLLVTPGDPAGIGLDILLAAAMQNHSYEMLAVADPKLIAERAKLLGLKVTVQAATLDLKATPSTAGVLKVIPVSCEAAVSCGISCSEHANYVVNCLDQAIDACLNQSASAMVTGPVNKASIIEAGYDFMGHTEYLATRTATPKVVMMLASELMRVALVTTHMAVSAISEAITKTEVIETLSIVHKDLRTRFGIAEPKIIVCGLNPHAGEGGHMGNEEILTIIPACEQLRSEGLNILGPLPADTAFTQKYLNEADVMVAMFHDQGLPVIKYASFGSTVNVTLGLPIIRTSVDHGTALDLAGTGQANPGSLFAALEMANSMASAQSSVQLQ